MVKTAEGIDMKKCFVFRLLRRYDDDYAVTSPNAVE